MSNIEVRTKQLLLRIFFACHRRQGGLLDQGFETTPFAYLVRSWVFLAPCQLEFGSGSMEAFDAAQQRPGNARPHCDTAAKATCTSAAKFESANFRAKPFCCTWASLSLQPQLIPKNQLNFKVGQREKSELNDWEKLSKPFNIVGPCKSRRPAAPPLHMSHGMAKP